MSQRVAPGRQLGPCELLEEIGRGGSSVVFRARHARLDRDVAIKVIRGIFDSDATFLARFRQEADFVSRLSHPHVLPLLESGQTGPDDDLSDLSYLVTEHMPGGSFSTNLAEERNTRERCLLAVSVGEQIGAALDYAHSQGVLHRDIKPSNILIADDGGYVLVHFGLARVLHGGASLHLTATGLVAGTPAYMAPEQALGEPADARTDVYGLAVVLYEIVAGQVPFEADTPLATMLAHVHQPPPAPRTVRPDVPRTLEVVLLHALAKERAERYASGGELAAAVRAAVAAAFGSRSLSPVRPTASPRQERAAGAATLLPFPGRERQRVAAARRPASRGRGRRVLRFVAGGVAAFAAVTTAGAGGLVLALGPGRPALAGIAAQFAANSTGPAWTEASPRDGAPNQPLQTRMIVRFSHEMDRESVESSFRVVPETPLSFEWDGRLLIATPLETLHENTAYVVTLDHVNSFDVYGRPLVASLRRRFVTQKPQLAPQPAAPANTGPGAAVPVFPFLPPPVPTAQPTAEPQASSAPSLPERPVSDGRVPATQTPRPVASARREVTVDATVPAPAYAPPTAPAQPLDTSIVAGFVITAEQADAELAGTPVATLVPAPLPSTTPGSPGALATVQSQNSTVQAGTTRVPATATAVRTPAAATPPATGTSPAFATWAAQAFAPAAQLGGTQSTPSSSSPASATAQAQTPTSQPSVSQTPRRLTAATPTAAATPGVTAAAATATAVGSRPATTEQALQLPATATEQASPHAGAPSSTPAAGQALSGGAPATPTVGAATSASSQ